jgi:hypothetical protein
MQNAKCKMSGDGERRRRHIFHFAILIWYFALPVSSISWQCLIKLARGASEPCGGAQQKTVAGVFRDGLGIIGERR